MLEATKVAHVGVVAALSRRRGPQLIRTSVWDEQSASWQPQDIADDGFSEIVGESENAKDNIKQIADKNPFEAERILALCAGKIGHREDWHEVNRLDSCAMGSTEIIYRITFSQDTKQAASDFRIARLKRCGNLWGILDNKDPLPPALEDFRKGFRFEWIKNSPHQNAISSENKRATVIYLGEDVNLDQVEAVKKMAAEFLHRAAAGPDESRDARQRLALWFRMNGELTLFDPHALVKYDTPGNESEIDIGRES